MKWASDTDATTRKLPTRLGETQFPKLDCAKFSSSSHRYFVLTLHHMIPKQAPDYLFVVASAALRICARYRRRCCATAECADPTALRSGHIFDQMPPYAVATNLLQSQTPTIFFRIDVARLKREGIPSAMMFITYSVGKMNMRAK